MHYEELTEQEAIDFINKKSNGAESAIHNS